MSLTMLDLGDAQPTYNPEPLPRLRPIWVGFVLAFAFLVAEVLKAAASSASTGGSASSLGLLTTLDALACWIYWLSCVHRFHRVLNQLSPYVAGQSTYPITPGQAVGYNFIPFYNLYWIFKWPSTLATFLRESLSVNVASGGFLGLVLFLGLLLARVIDGFLGFTCIFFIGLYISRKLRRAMEEHERLRTAAETFT